MFISYSTSLKTSKLSLSSFRSTSIKIVKELLFINLESVSNIEEFILTNKQNTFTSFKSSLYTNSF